MSSTTRSKRRKTPSTVALRGAPEGEGGTAKPPTKNTAEEKKFEGDLKKKIEEVKRLKKNAESTLIEAHGVEVHAAFRCQYDATGMLQQGMSYRTTAQRTDPTTLGPNDQEAFEMQKKTNSTLSIEDIATAEYRCQANPSKSNGLFAGWKETNETTKNSIGKEVSKNRSIVAKEEFKYLEENNMGLAKWSKEHSHNLKTEIPKKAILIPHFISIGGEGEYFTFAEVPSTWHKEVKYHDVLAQLFGYSGITEIVNTLSNRGNELGGMITQRFIGDQIVVRKGMSQEDYRMAGYKFIFKDDNNTRFDVLQDSNSSISDDAEGDSKPSAK